MNKNLEKFLWIVVGAFIMLIVASIWNFYTPKPKIEVKCSIDRGIIFGITFHLDNPSKKVFAKDYNLIIQEKYGGSGTSYVSNELCEIGIYDYQPEYTLVHCDYIPPESQIDISFNFNKTLTQFKYSSWGETTKKEEHQKIICKK